jgi:putative DNA primase/helicase
MDTDATLPPNDLQQSLPEQTAENPPQKENESPPITLQDQMIAESENHPGFAIPSVATGDQIGTTRLDWAGICPYFPVGKITVLAGYPGVGKTAIALAVAAQVTSKEKRNVLYISHEDAIADTILPRFKDAGGDERRLVFCDGYLEDPDENGLRDKVQKRIDHNWSGFLGYVADVAKLKLIVFDPLDPLYRGVNSVRETKVREAISGIANMARDHKCAVLFITHLNRRNNRTAIDQIRDNTILANIARSIVLAGELTNEPGAYAMVHIKCNVTERGQSMKYTFEDGAFEWRGTVNVNSDDIFPHAGRDATTPGLMTAKIYLVDKLKYGPVNVDDIEMTSPCSKATLVRAKAALGVCSMKSRVANGEWYWCLKCLNPKMDLTDYYEV